VNGPEAALGIAEAERQACWETAAMMLLCAYSDLSVTELAEVARLRKQIDALDGQIKQLRDGQRVRWGVSIWAKCDDGRAVPLALI